MASRHNGGRCRGDVEKENGIFWGREEKPNLISLSLMDGKTRSKILIFPFIRLEVLWNNPCRGEVGMERLENMFSGGEKQPGMWSERPNLPRNTEELREVPMGRDTNIPCDKSVFFPP